MFTGKIVVFALLAFAPSIEAAIVFTDFQATICCTLGVSNHGGSPQGLAGQFIPGANYIMTDAQVKVEENGTFVPTFNLFLYSDLTGLPGVSLGAIGGGTAPSSAAFNIVTVGSPAFFLNSGTPYWLVMTPNTSTDVFWAGGGFPSPLSAYDQSAIGASPWFLPGTAVSLQFQIDGTPAGTPEPGTWILFGTAMAGFWLARRRARSL